MRLAVAEGSPQWMRRAFGPAVLYADMLFTDHGIFRMIYLNKHRLGPKVWRSAQPAPHHIEKFVNNGIRTIINLRGNRVCGSYWLEQKACAAHGLKLIDFQIRSRAAPGKQELIDAKALFERIEYPMLMHCKSGADRAGLMSVLYSIFVLGQSIEQAKQQLSFKYGHIRQSETGILDYFFECYLEHNAKTPIDFLDWVETVYDPDELKTSFASRSMANLVVNKILRRE